MTVPSLHLGYSSNYDKAEKTFDTWSKQDPNTWTDAQSDYFNDVMNYSNKYTARRPLFAFVKGGLSLLLKYRYFIRTKRLSLKYRHKKSRTDVVRLSDFSGFEVVYLTEAALQQAFESLAVAVSFTNLATLR